MTREQRAPLGSESDSSNPFVLWMVVEAVGVETLIEVGVGIIAVIGTIVLKQDPKDECAAKYSNCMDSPLGNLVVDKHRHSLCETCRDRCVKEGGWPMAVLGFRKWHSCR